MDQSSSFKQQAEQATNETASGLKKLAEIDSLLNSMATLPEGEILAESIDALAEMEREAVALIQSSTALQRELLLKQKTRIEDLYRRIDK